MDHGITGGGDRSNMDTRSGNPRFRAIVSFGPSDTVIGEFDTRKERDEWVEDVRKDPSLRVEWARNLDSD
jgi:hypothetical protein